MRRIAALIFAVLALALVAAGCGGGGDSTGSSSSADTGSSSTESSTDSSESSDESESDESESESSDEAEEESGSEDESEEAESGSSGAAPAKAAFIKEADKICSTADVKLSEEVVAYAKKEGISIEEEPSKDDQTKIYEEVVLPNIHKQAEDLEGLTPPAGDESEVEDIVSTLTQEVEDAESDPGNISEDTLKEASEKAQKYGLQTCGG
jgi:hypothetical protein